MEKICNYLGRGAGRSFPQGLICGSKAACGEQEEDEHPHPAGGPWQQWADQKHCLPFSRRAQTTGARAEQGTSDQCPSAPGAQSGVGGQGWPGGSQYTRCAFMCLLVCLGRERFECGASPGLGVSCVNSLPLLHGPARGRHPLPGAVTHAVLSHS